MIKDIDFSKGEGLVPAIVQDSVSKRVLMLGYMNQEAFEKTLTTRKVTFFSRSRQQLWTKGAVSGNTLELEHILLDCDQDTLLIYAKPAGPVCHKGWDTCFQEVNKRSFFTRLQQVIAGRKNNPSPGSYTSSLFSKGTASIAQKVGEEATEVIIEAMKGDQRRLKEESADLLFHFLVLLEDQGLKFEDVERVLEERHGKKH